MSKKDKMKQDSEKTEESLDENFKDENKEDVQEDTIKDESSSTKEDVKSEEDKNDNVDEKDELSRTKDQLIRLQADFANFKRRTENEKKEYLELGSKKVILEILQIIDNFERALDAKIEDNNYTKGIEMIYKQLNDLLVKNNVTAMDSLNKKFDPNLHHAVLVEPKEGVEEGIVIDVLQKGYMIGDKVLRPAMVRVSE